MARNEALWGLLIADALAMPVHWYYNPMDIRNDYGKWLTGYEEPNSKHPSSILTLSATDGSGRKSGYGKSQSVIGNVILHDKLKYWQGDASTHYHQGMKAGENTLNAQVALQTTKTLCKVDPNKCLPLSETLAKVLENYVRFMTTPGSHNDTYAESFHRIFFKDWMTSSKPRDGHGILKFCQSRYEGVKLEDGQLASIGSLVLAIPWILHFSDKPVEECCHLTQKVIQCTHPAPSLMPYIECYTTLLHSIVNGADLKSQVEEALQTELMGGSAKLKLVQDICSKIQMYPVSSEAHLKACQQATIMLGSACYINGAMSTMLFLAYLFHNDFEKGVLTNTNCGGENAHRGAALGALLASNAVNRGQKIAQNLKNGLCVSQEVELL